MAQNCNNELRAFIAAKLKYWLLKKKTLEFLFVYNFSIEKHFCKILSECAVFKL